MTQRGYSTSTEGAVALVAATAKSILGIQSGAAFSVQVKSYSVGFDGVTSSAVPVLVELCYVTFATNPPGTASTGTTEDQRYGRVLAAGVTGARNWTTEPTVITPYDEFLLTPNAGLVIRDFALGQEADSAFSEGFVIRCTAPAAVNVRGTLVWEPC